MRTFLAPCAAFTAIVIAWVPAAMAAPSAALQLTGRGSQIYTYKAAGPGFNWVLAGPDADLFDRTDKIIIHHFAGPSWRAKDGSTIVAEVLSSSAAPVADAVPWLVLKVRSKVGDGVLADVSYITRTDTHGGMAPATGCDAAHVNEENRAPYSALYTFFPQKQSPGL